MNGSAGVRSVGRIGRGLLLLSLAVQFPAFITAGASAQDRSAQDFAVVVCADYLFATGEYHTIELDPPRAPQYRGLATDDPVVRYDYEEDMVFIVNRLYWDNIQLVDPNQEFTTVPPYQYSVGNGSNPHDIKLASHDKAYVSRFDSLRMLVVDPFTGDYLDFIDLSSFADVDSMTEMDQMAIVDGKLLVTLSHLNRGEGYNPEGPGMIVVIDTATDTLIDVDPGSPGMQALTMQLRNPYSELRLCAEQGKVVVACPGFWDSLDGGVEAIDPFSLTSEVLITESALGGDVLDALLASPSKGFAVVQDVPPGSQGRLVAFNPLTHQVTDTLRTAAVWSLGSIELNERGELYLCDQGFDYGVHVYDVTSHEDIAWVSLPLPPVDIAFVESPSYTAVNSGKGESGTLISALGPNYPNPFNPLTTIPFTLAREMDVTVDVLDVRGKRVATLFDGFQSAGRHHLTWAGEDDTGRELAAGVYFYRLRTTDAELSRKMLLAR